MKTIIITFIILFTIPDNTFTQCGIDQKELREKYCMGSYLVHSVLYSSSPKVEIALKEGNNYAIYLFNQIHPVLGFRLTDSRNKVISLSSRHYENYSVYTLAPLVSDTYTFSVDFGTWKDGCVLWAIYLQNENYLKAGFYKNFEDLKFNNASGEFKYKITERSKKYSGNEIDYYSLVIDRKEAKSIGKIFGFSDGKNIYINEHVPSLRQGTDFVRAEFMYRYFYYEGVRQLIIPIGSYNIIVPKVDQKIMDMNTGEVSVLTNRNLREIIADNHRLLEEFINDPQRNKKLKDYLEEYLKTKYQN